MKDLSIIIVNFNTKDFLINCLESLFTNISKNISCEVIIVDNNSNDGSIDAVKKILNNHSYLTLIENNENVGFSKANNIGISKSTGEYILFINTDTIMKPDVLEAMFDFMNQTPNAGAATCLLRLPSGEIDDATHRGFPTPWNAICYFSGIARIFPKSMLFNGYNMGWKDMDKTHEIDALAGAFMMVKRKAGDEVGWWDEDYFFYGEDLDFCYKLKQKGWKIYFVPSVEILHYKGVSGGIKKESQHISKASDETKLLATNARFDAMKIFYRKHYRKSYPSIVTWIVLQGIGLKRRITLGEML